MVMGNKQDYTEQQNIINSEVSYYQNYVILSFLNEHVLLLQ